MKKNALCLFVLLIILTTAAASEELRLKIVVTNARVREKPDFQSSVIAQVEQNTVLTAISQQGDWYQIELPALQGKTRIRGFLHKSVVAEIPAKEEPSSSAPEPKSQAQEKTTGSPLSAIATSEEEARLQEIETAIRRESLAFLTLIKKMKPQAASGTSSRNVDMVRIIVQQTNVYETLDENSQIIYRPRINEEFEILSRNEPYYRIRLKDGREGWIQESFIQLFSGKILEPRIAFGGIKPSETLEFLATSEDLYGQIQRNKASADEIYQSSRRTQAVAGSYDRIQKYSDYAQEFYKRYIENKAGLYSSAEDLGSRISAWAELLLGSQDYRTKYISFPQDKSSGLTRDISVGGNVLVTNSSNFGITFQNKKDIIQTPYSSTNIDTTFSLAPKGGLRLDTGFNYNTYQDDLNRLNDYSRMTFRSGLNTSLAARTGLKLEYSFLNNSFSKSKDNSFTDHRVQAEIRRNVNPLSDLIFRINSQIESSKSAFHKFAVFEPSVSFEKTSPKKRWSMNFAYENISYSDLKLKNYGRASLAYVRSASGETTSHNTNLGLVLKNYPNNSLQSYIQILGRYSSTKNGPFASTFAPSFYTYLYTKNSQNSFTDMRLDFNGGSGFLSGSLSGYFRYWHTPKSGQGKNAVIKPHVFDLSGNLGFNLKYLRIGPAIGLHTLLSSKNESFIKRDGNLFRFGGMIDGLIPIYKQIRLSLNASYEKGFVFSEEVSVNPLTGNLSYGKIVQRHPTTLQVQALLTVPIQQKLDMVIRVNNYVIDTDLDAKLSINPVKQNSRFQVLVGIKYRYQ